MTMTHSARRAPVRSPGRRRNPSRQQVSFPDIAQQSAESMPPRGHVLSQAPIINSTESCFTHIHNRPSRKGKVKEVTLPHSRVVTSIDAHSDERLWQVNKKKTTKGTNPDITTLPLPIKRRRLLVPQTSQLGHHANVPNWQDPRIPFGFWAAVFQYAAAENSSNAVRLNWLLHVSTTGKIFSEPAIMALYRCPMIKHQSKAKRLAALIGRDPAETFFNYRVKIEFLHIDVHIVPQAVLFQLIRHLPRLKEVIFFTPMDQPPYRKLDATIRWHYPEDIFRALNPAPKNSDPASVKRLKSWEWSGRLIGGYVSSIQDLGRIHQMAPFSHLSRLSFTNFQVPSLRNVELKLSDDEDDLEGYHEDGVFINAIALAISRLENLRHLVFESSTVMNERLLPLLPKNLVHFELINCWEIKSEDLSMFLLSHGSNLRTLSLMHNQSLNLAFLKDLADSCPSLRELYMNLSYYRHHDSLNDADPMYDLVLLPNQVPTWPPRIRVIDIEHIRNWTVETAKMFLQSLVDNAQNLPDLRHLVIKTMLDIPWQDRADLRHKFRPLIEKVFLKPFKPPNDYTSIRQLRRVNEIPTPQKRKRLASSGNPSRRSVRIAAKSRLPRRDPKATRLQDGRHPFYRELDTDEDEFNISESSNDEASGTGNTSAFNEHPTLVIQGLCTTVSIQFDNQKIRELQYSMEDFLPGDDGDSSEKEWDGDDHEDDTAIAF